MKKNVSALFLALLLLASCGPSLEVNLDAVPKDRPAYGWTRQGVFFIHQSLLGNPPDKGNVVFASEITGWKSRKASRRGDYWLYNIVNNPMDIRSFANFTNMKIEFFFVVNEAHVPHHLVKKHKDLFPKSDLGGHGRVGATFFTRPVDKGPWQP